MSILEKVASWRDAGPDRIVKIDGDKQEIRLYDQLHLFRTVPFTANTFY